MQAIILDKSYLQGASRIAIQNLMERRTLVMCGALFYPAALAQAFPESPLTLDHLLRVAEVMEPSPAVENT